MIERGIRSRVGDFIGLKGRVTEEFGVYSVMVREMEKVGVKLL